MTNGIPSEPDRVRLRETLQRPALRIQDLHPELASRGVRVDQNAMSNEDERPGQQRPQRRSAVQGDESVPAAAGQGPEPGPVSQPALCGRGFRCGLHCMGQERRILRCEGVRLVLGGIVDPDLITHHQRSERPHLMGVEPVRKPVRENGMPPSHAAPADAVPAERQLHVDHEGIGMVDGEQTPVDALIPEHRHLVELGPGGIARIRGQHRSRDPPVDEVGAV